MSSAGSGRSRMNFAAANCANRDVAFVWRYPNWYPALVKLGTEVGDDGRLGRHHHVPLEVLLQNDLKRIKVLQEKEQEHHH